MFDLTTLLDVHNVHTSSSWDAISLGLVEISSGGRMHSCTATIQLLHPQTQQPCRLSEWRAAVPSASADERSILLAVGINSNAVSAEHGVRLSMSMHGQSAYGEVKLVEGSPPSWLLTYAKVFEPAE